MYPKNLKSQKRVLSMNKALLVLADGVYFEGVSFGATGEVIGEVVFNTSMTGYQEILTDPSYKGQIVAMTYTQIGNYGVNEDDIESDGGIKAEGLIVKEACHFPSSWRSELSLSDYLKKHGIIGIQGIDTRALTRHLRDNGAQMGVISTEETNPEKLLDKVRSHPGINGVDLARYVSAEKPYEWTQTIWQWKNPVTPRQTESMPTLLVFDFGVKMNILRNLVNVGFKVKVVPANTRFEEALQMNTDGVFLSNGPGDPAAVGYAIQTVKKLIGKKPILGICMGHQILGLALGGNVYKLKFGHHGGNHPVMDLETRQVEITAQNHNYCVNVKGLSDQVELTHRNLYDGTEEGMKHRELPIYSVQYHPEASPGPNDSTYIFQRFRQIIQ
jgi:carbamoyl-phosphate synthase small subunit